MSKKVLMVLPSKDFDTTETSVPWKVLSEGGVHVEFCTEDGKLGECDPLLLSGVIFGQLGASLETKKIYGEMIETKEFKATKKYADVDFMLYDAVLLPGGHAPGMKQYLENQVIRDKLVPYFKNEDKIVGAVCHGTIVLARALDPSTGKSLLHQRKSTTLPKYMERTAYYLTAWKLGKYYRTYEEYVEDEVRSCMRNPSLQLNLGPNNLFGSMDKCYAYVCVDGNYISARWPGDVQLWSQTILQKLLGLDGQSPF